MSSRGAGRMLRQALAATGGVGICAGVDFLTPGALVNTLAGEHGLDAELGAWRSRRLDFAVWAQLTELANAEVNAPLTAHLSQAAPARPQSLARRVARLFRHYLAQSPELVAGWLDGIDVGVDGLPLPGQLAWQPELLRRTAHALGVDPIKTQFRLTEAVRNAPRPARTAVVAVAELSRPELDLIAALAAAGPLPTWHIPTPHLRDWAAPLAGSVEAIATGEPRPRVLLHGSHGPTRQAQVLRDELCRLMTADPTLEPREIAIVTPDLGRWWPVLQSVFAPLPDADAHPGRQLRLQASGVVAEANLVLGLLADALALCEGRATAAQVIDLLTARPVAHRWRLTDRAKVTQLVADGEVRWGLDAAHRASQGLADITQNTWTRGLDRLLAGLAIPPGEVALPVTGVAGVSSSDIELIGTLCELVSRLRRFAVVSETDTTPAEWAARSRGLIADLVGLTWADDWMLRSALAALGELEADLSRSQLMLSRAQFRRIVADLASDAAVRPAVGNGSMQVMALGDLLHVGFRVVCFIGVSDAPPTPMADLLPLGTDVPNPRRVQLAKLLAHARAAEQVVILRQDRSVATNLPTAAPTAITWLLHELDADTEPVPHPLAAHSPSNFSSAHPSYDLRAAAGARALLRRDPTAPSAASLRRNVALHLPVSDAPLLLTPADLVSFLRDPLKVFLKSAAGIRLFDDPSTKDTIPLVRSGLEVWGTRERLLTAAQQGITVTDAERSEIQRETLPPGEIGRLGLAPEVALISDLWGLAKEAWQGVVVNHPVDLSIGGVKIRGAVRTRGGRVVRVTPSEGPRTMLAPWVDLLLLAASGITAEGVIHRFEKHSSKIFPKKRFLTQPTPEAAADQLAWLATATRLGHSRLVPLPLTPAVAYLEVERSGKGNLRAWDLPCTNWKSPWAWRDSQWELFYDGVPSQLFSDPPTPLDPPTLSGSGFEAWTRALIAPMIEGID